MIGVGIVGIFLFLIFYYHKKPYKLVTIQIYYSVIAGFAIYNLGAPRASIYVCDLINVILLLSLFGTPGGRARVREFRHRCKYTGLGMVLFFLVGTISALVNFSGISSIVLYFWSLRNYYRFFLFFVIVACYLNDWQLPDLFKNLRYLLYLSTVLSAYQYFILGYGKTGHSGDLIGGIYGTVTLGNASVCLFAAGLCAYFISGYLHKEASIFQVVSVIVCSLISAVLGEIKFFFFVLIAIGMVLIISNKPNIKTVLITVFGAIALSFALTVIQEYYSGSGTRSLNSIEGIIDYVTKSSYSYSTDSINRIGGIVTIKRLFFGGKNSMLGVGLGMADHSSFFSSRIFDQYGYTNYSWFLIPYLYLETGIIGVIAYFSIFFGMLADTLKITPSLAVARKSGIILFFISIMMIIYNCSLRVDAAYAYFAFLSIPFVYLGNDFEDSTLGKPKKRFRWG